MIKRLLVIWARLYFSAIGFSSSVFILWVLFSWRLGISNGFAYCLFVIFDLLGAL